MDVKEKLVELLDTNFGYVEEVKAEVLADRLIFNGVTMQAWISVKDRLPAESGYYLVVYRDDFNGSKSVSFDFYVNCAEGEWWDTECGRTAIYWMPLPELPEGE